MTATSNNKTLLGIKEEKPHHRASSVSSWVLVFLLLFSLMEYIGKVTKSLFTTKCGKKSKESLINDNM